VTLKSKLWITEGRWKWHHSIDHIRLTISRVIWHWIISWPWNVGYRSLKVIENGTMWKLGYSFLFAFYSNYGRICSHTRVTPNRHSLVLSYTPSITVWQTQMQWQQPTETTHQHEWLNRRTRGNKEVLNLQLVCLVCNAVVVEYQVVGNDELILLVTAKKCVVHFLLRHVTFLFTQQQTSLQSLSDTRHICLTSHFHFVCISENLRCAAQCRSR